MKNDITVNEARAKEDDTAHAVVSSAENLEIVRKYVAAGDPNGLVRALAQTGRSVRIAATDERIEVVPDYPLVAAKYTSGSGGPHGRRAPEHKPYRRWR